MIIDLLVYYVIVHPEALGVSLINYCVITAFSLVPPHVFVKLPCMKKMLLHVWEIDQGHTKKPAHLLLPKSIH